MVSFALPGTTVWRGFKQPVSGLVIDSIWIAQAVRSLTIHLAVGQDDDKKEMKCGKESGVEGSRSHSRLR